MNLDELKTRLAEQDAKLDRAIRLNETVVRELHLSKTKTSLRWLVPGIVVELLMTIVAVVWLGDFIAGHIGEPRFLVPAVLVDACAIALMGSYIHQLVVIGSLDYGLPVVAVQKALGRLRVLRIRTTKWTLILSFALWFPIAIVLFEGLVGVDPWMILGAIAERHSDFLVWIVANLLFGLLVALLLIWAWRRYAERAEPSPAVRRFMDDVAGRSLAEALGALDAIARFEADPRGEGAGPEG